MAVVYAFMTKFNIDNIAIMSGMGRNLKLPKFTDTSIEDADVNLSISSILPYSPIAITIIVLSSQ